MTSERFIGLAKQIVKRDEELFEGLRVFEEDQKKLAKIPNRKTR